MLCFSVESEKNQFVRHLVEGWWKKPTYGERNSNWRWNFVFRQDSKKRREVRRIADQIFCLQVLEHCGCVLFPKGLNLDLTRGLLYVVLPIWNWSVTWLCCSFVSHRKYRKRVACFWKINCLALFQDTIKCRSHLTSRCFRHGVVTCSKLES